jgi:4-hydroxyphenylpyruvate dioxygenase-like putative hemolysin
MNEKEWVEKIKRECMLNVGHFDTRYAIQLVGRSGSKLGIIDKAKYEKFYDKFYNRNNKDRREPLVIDYHIEHSIGRKGFQELWDFYYKKIKK